SLSWFTSPLPHLAGQPSVLDKNGLRGACEFYTHTHDIRGLHPFPPSEHIGGGPKERESQAFSHRATPSASQLELAEGVEFLEKYAHLDHLESPFGGRGSSAALGRSGGPWAARHPARQSEGPLGHLATPARSREG